MNDCLGIATACPLTNQTQQLRHVHGFRCDLTMHASSPFIYLVYEGWHRHWPVPDIRSMWSIFLKQSLLTLDDAWSLCLLSKVRALLAVLLWWSYHDRSVCPFLLSSLYQCSTGPVNLTLFQWAMIHASKQHFVVTTTKVTREERYYDVPMGTTIPPLL